MGIFDYDGPLMTGLGKLADIITVNIMFIMFSIPIFTIGASLTAMHRSLQYLIEDTDDGIIVRTFWREFKKNFKQSTILWLICMGIIVLLTLYYFLITMFSGAIGKTYRITLIAMVLIFMFGFLYLFPLQSRYENTIKNTLKNAWLVSVMAFPWTLGALAILAAAAGLSYMIMLSGGYIVIFVWLVCGFGIVAYLQGLIFKKVFEKITPPIHKEYEMSKDAVFTDEEHRTDDRMLSEGTYSDPNWNRKTEETAEKYRKSDKKRHK